jgi:hypothetical protein
MKHRSNQHGGGMTAWRENIKRDERIIILRPLIGVCISKINDNAGAAYRHMVCGGAQWRAGKSKRRRRELAIMKQTGGSISAAACAVKRRAEIIKYIRKSRRISIIARAHLTRE